MITAHGTLQVGSTFQAITAARSHCLVYNTKYTCTEYGDLRVKLSKPPSRQSSSAVGYVRRSREILNEHYYF